MTGDQICRGACLSGLVDVLGLRFTFLCPYKETTAGACHRSLPLQSTPQVQIRVNNPLQYDKTTPFEISNGGWADMPREEYKMLTYRVGFFDWSAQFSVPKWKTMGSQSEILFHEIPDVQKILVGWTTFFFLVLKFGRTSQKNHPLFYNVKNGF